MYKNRHADKKQYEKYKKRFQNLFDNPRTNEAVYKAAKMMLQHRDGTPFEDMYLIDEATGAIVGVSNSDSKVKGVVYNSSIKKALEEYGKNTLIALHNHPQGFPPSASDLNAVWNNEAVRCGMTIGHNGTIYKYTQPKKMIKPEVYERAFKSFKEQGYSEVTCQENALQDEYDFKLEVL